VASSFRFYLFSDPSSDFMSCFIGFDI